MLRPMVALILTSGTTLRLRSAISILLLEISGKITINRMMVAMRVDLMITMNTIVMRSWLDNVSVNFRGGECP